MSREDPARSAEAERSSVVAVCDRHETADEAVQALRDAGIDPVKQKLDPSVTEHPAIADRALLTVAIELVPLARHPEESP
jgi:hypothetical protein